MKRISAFISSALLFTTTLLIEAYLVYSIAPHSYTSKEINDFMLISMGLGFVPIFVLASITTAAIGTMVFMAFYAARLLWRIIAREQKH